KVLRLSLAAGASPPATCNVRLVVAGAGSGLNPADPAPLLPLRLNTFHDAERTLFDSVIDSKANFSSSPGRTLPVPVRGWSVTETVPSVQLAMGCPVELVSVSVAVS